MINNKNYIPNIFGISLIFLNKYIYSLLLFYNLQGYIAGAPVEKGFYLSVLALFIFCFFIFFFLEKKFSNNIVYLFLLNCILLSLTLHVFLNFTDIPAWKHLRAEIFGLTTNRFYIASWYFLPFITFAILNILLIKKLVQLRKFLIILGIVFFISFLYNFFSKFNPIKTIQNMKTEEVAYNKNKKKVVWIIFDEFDYRIALQNKNLKNFELLKNQSLILEKMYATSNATISAVPEMLTGFITENVEIVDSYGKLNLIGENNKKINLSFDNSIFGKINKLGYSSSIFGVYHPYCYIFREVKNCTPIEVHHKNIKWYDGIFHITFIHLIDKFFNNKLGLNSDRDKYQIDLMDKHLNFKNDLTFMHFGFPHLPSLYAQKFFKKKTKNSIEDYNLNLELTDFVLGKILNKIQEIYKNKEDKLLIIFSSDHWFLEYRESRPVLFSAKLLNDNQNLVSTKNYSNYAISKLIYSFFIDNINSNKDILNFLNNTEFYPTRYHDKYTTKQHKH